ncbi:MAG: ABC transporter ATP-binding protein, partial [Tenericutes bacterium]|nr:ABC transporter ATP-binding protein [Mycoplasmatota bacterium]
TFYNVYNKVYKECTSIGIEHTYKNSIFSLSRFSTGEYLNLMSSDVDIISSFFSNGIYRVIQLCEFLVIYYFFFTVNILLFYVTLFFSVIVLILIVIFGNKIQVYNKERKENLDKKTSAINDVFAGINEIKGFNVGKTINNKVNKETNKYTSSNARYAIVYNSINIAAVYFFEILRLLVFIYGIYLIVDGKMELGSLLIIYSYYQKIIDNFSLVSTLNLEYKNVKMSLIRFGKLFENSREENDSDIEINDPIGKIDFNHVLYGYRHDPILNDFTVTIKPNSITAITGKTGSGKTGIFDLLMKMNRQIQGNILIDGIDISSINDVCYYNLISVARKNPLFFDCSIKENLLLIGKEFKEIEKVCKLVGIHEHILKLEKGYDTVISNEKNVLSSSDKRLLSIARVLLKDTKIFLFDEIIETLDKEHRMNIMSILEEKKKNHTILIISRDKKLLKITDEIIIMNSGILSGVGTHKELSNKNDLYKEIA